MLKNFLPREKFTSYEDFMENYQVVVPENFNFSNDVVDAWAKQEPDKPALVWCNDAGDERRMSFSDISMESARAAAAFSRLGMKKGDTVLFLMKRRWQFWVYAPAFMRLGVIFIPATVQLKKKDIEYRVKAASVDMIITITETDIAKAVEEALPACPEVRSVCYIESDAKAKALEKPFTAPAGWVDLNAFVASISDEEAISIRDAERIAGGKDPMLLYFTSGTTGMLKWFFMTSSIRSGHIVTLITGNNTENDLHISVADTGWAKCGWGKIYGQWICGAANFVYDMERFMRPISAEASYYKVTTFCAPPTIYRYMIQDDLSKYDLPHFVWRRQRENRCKRSF